MLRNLEDVIPERFLTNQQSADLREIFRGCSKVLGELDEMVEYLDLDSHGPGKPKRFKKNLTWVPDDVKDLRSRLTSNVGLLNAFEGGLAL